MLLPPVVWYVEIIILCTFLIVHCVNLLLLPVPTVQIDRLFRCGRCTVDSGCDGLQAGAGGSRARRRPPPSTTNNLVVPVGGWMLVARCCPHALPRAHAADAEPPFVAGPLGATFLYRCAALYAFFRIDIMLVVGRAAQHRSAGIRCCHLPWVISGGGLCDQFLVEYSIFRILHKQWTFIHVCSTHLYMGDRRSVI